MKRFTLDNDLFECCNQNFRGPVIELRGELRGWFSVLCLKVRIQVVGAVCVRGVV